MHSRILETDGDYRGGNVGLIGGESVFVCRVNIDGVGIIVTLPLAAHMELNRHYAEKYPWSSTIQRLGDVLEFELDDQLNVEVNDRVYLRFEVLKR